MSWTLSDDVDEVIPSSGAAGRKYPATCFNAERYTHFVGIKPSQKGQTDRVYRLAIHGLLGSTVTSTAQPRSKGTLRALSLYFLSFISSGHFHLCPPRLSSIQVNAPNEPGRFHFRLAIDGEFSSRGLLSIDRGFFFHLSHSGRLAEHVLFDRYKKQSAQSR